MHVEGDVGVGHDAFGDLGCLLGVKAAIPEDRCQLTGLGLGVFGQRTALDLEFAFDELVLRSNAHPLAGGHRDRSGQQTRYARQTHERTIGRGAGDAENQGDVGDQSVAHPEDRRPSVSALDVAVVVDHLEAVMLIRGAVHASILPWRPPEGVSRHDGQPSRRDRRVKRHGETQQPGPVRPVG